MSFTTFTGEVNNISQLSDTPTITEGLSPDELKARFDLGGARIKDFINNTLIPQLERTSAAANIGAQSVNGFSQFTDVQTGLSLIINKLLKLSEEFSSGAIIAQNAISTEKVQNGAITNPKLGNNAITEEKIVSGAVSTTFTATLGTTWSGSGPYTQTVEIEGLLATDNPIIDVTASGTFATDKKRDEEFSKVYRATVQDGSITFYAKEAPTVELPVRLLCVRK